MLCTRFWFKDMINFMGNSDYWNHFYKTSVAAFPSPFARWISDRYLTYPQKIVEFGCGDGRDSIFFSDSGHSVHAVDQSAVGIQRLQNHESFGESLSTSCVLISEIFDGDLPDMEGFDLIYSRFFLHAISRADQEAFFNFIESKVSKNVLVAHEFRVLEDMENFVGKKITEDELVTDHYRRFIDFEELVENLSGRGWVIDYAEKSRGFAPFGSEDPWIGRIVACFVGSKARASG